MKEMILLSMGPSRMRKPAYRLPRGGRLRNAADGDDLLPLVEEVEDAVADQRQPVAHVPAEVVVQQPQPAGRSCRGWDRGRT